MSDLYETRCTGDIDIAKHVSLESVIDSFGMFAVIEAMEMVCDAKSEHIATNWQDIYLAKQWEKTARDLEAIKDKAP